MKYLGIDLGEKNVGLSISDSKGIIAEPLKVIQRSTDDELIKNISRICEEKGIEKIIVGVPESADSKIQNEFKNFANILESETHLPVDTWDETFSTKQAQNMVAFSDSRRGKKTSEHKDSVAAAVILQEYMDYENRH